MKILITGGTGFIGTEVTKRLLKQDHEIVILTRHKPEPQNKPKLPGVSFVEYSYKADSKIPEELIQDIDGIINMAGEPIFTGRWNEEKMKRIKDSRINITRQLVDSISGLKDKKPRTLVNASAVGYYGPGDETELTEDSPAGNDFLAKVSRQWEKEALRAADFGVRTVVLRTGIVLDKGGGALAKIILPFKLFIGGPVGSGDQYFSWIHMDDMAELYVSSLTDTRLSGPVNATAPNPVTMKEFSRAIGKILKRPSWLPIPAFMAKIVIGGSAQVVVTGQRVIPKKLLSINFPFQYKHIEEALKKSLFK
jgi:uncharacterized protein (TIGR01777 family)